MYDDLNVLHEPDAKYLFNMPHASEEYIKENLGEEIYNYISISIPNLVKRMLTFHLERYLNNKTKEEIKEFINKLDI